MKCKRPVVRGRDWRQAQYKKLDRGRSVGIQAALELIKKALPNIQAGYLELALKGMVQYWELFDSHKDKLTSREAQRQAEKFINGINKTITTWNEMHPSIQMAVLEKTDMECMDALDILPWIAKWIANPKGWVYLPDPRNDRARLLLNKVLARVWNETKDDQPFCCATLAKDDPEFSKLLVDIFQCTGITKRVKAAIKDQRKSPRTIREQMRNDLG